VHCRGTTERGGIYRAGEIVRHKHLSYLNEYNLLRLGQSLSDRATGVELEVEDGVATIRNATSFLREVLEKGFVRLLGVALVILVLLAHAKLKR